VVKLGRSAIYSRCSIFCRLAAYGKPGLEGAFHLEPPRRCRSCSEPAGAGATPKIGCRGGLRRPDIELPYFSPNANTVSRRGILKMGLFGNENDGNLACSSNRTRQLRQGEWRKFGASAEWRKSIGNVLSAFSGNSRGTLRAPPGALHFSQHVPLLYIQTRRSSENA
jgi:hypothetical protein